MGRFEKFFFVLLGFALFGSLTYFIYVTYVIPPSLESIPPEGAMLNEEEIPLWDEDYQEAPPPDTMALPQISTTTVATEEQPPQETAPQ
ncbi:MAG TPA: hypothetical protein PK876_06780 [Elusimicrobiota bacterium]|nr:hypothetical protein [Elusimicrobiota bacterium]